MNLLQLTFGDNTDNHQQAVFAALSFMRDPHIRRVLVVTDRPDFYRWLSGTARNAPSIDDGGGDASGKPGMAPVETLPITAETLTAWQGPQQFFWRIKIQAVAMAVRQYPGQHLLYVDSDTFLAGSLADMVRQLDAGAAYMHCFEDCLGDRNSRTLTRTRRALAGRTLEGITLSGRHEMWNAGVIGLPASTAAERVAQALQLCDAMCATDCPRRLIEQFAFSLALQQGTLHPCQDVIGHYWGNKPAWNRLIAGFLAEARLKDETVAQAVARMGQVDWRALPLEHRQRRWVLRLKAGIDWVLPPKKLRHFTPG